MFTLDEIQHTLKLGIKSNHIKWFIKKTGNRKRAAKALKSMMHHSYTMRQLVDIAS